MSPRVDEAPGPVRTREAAPWKTLHRGVLFSGQTWCRLARRFGEWQAVPMLMRPDVLKLDFTSHDERGTVSVSYGVNDHPEGLGYAILGLPSSTAVAQGFPVMEATVHYEGDGYYAWMGWIQVVSTRQHGDEPVAIIDGPPNMDDVAHPYCAWGVRPTLFDAPSTTDRGVEWRAQTFLTASPDGVMTKTVLPLCGYEWGYDINEVGEVTVVPPRPLDLASSWPEACKILKRECPAWRLVPAPN